MASRNPKRCPDCGANNHPDTVQCVICGHKFAKSKTRRTQKIVLPIEEDGVRSPRLYESGEGEDDLMVEGVTATPLTGMVAFFIFLLTVAIVVGLILLILAGREEPNSGDGASNTGNDSSALQGILTETGTPLPTNTRFAPVRLATITPMPVTPVTETPTPTEEACIQVAREGDTVYAMALRCGHQHLSVVPVIVQANPNLRCETCLQVGQQLSIPWPTPTAGAEGAFQPTLEGTADEPAADAMVSNNTEADVPVNELGTPDGVATLFMEPTLRNGLMWHTVLRDENLIIIAQTYRVDAKVLSDLNPEIEFRQCDFSERYGGPNCNVMIYEGQRMRVPAPTATPTIPPTPSGSETPTPSPTATFNVPAGLSPQEGAYFDANSLVTLRWTASGTLAFDEVYLITVIDRNTRKTFTAQTVELQFVLPSAWQPEGAQVHTFQWTVAIARVDGNRVVNKRAETTPRTFDWQGLP